MEAFVEDLLLTLAHSGKSIKVYVQAHFPWLHEIVLGLFAAINSLRILAYVPQIVKAAKDENGASAISYMTWTLFLVSHLTTIGYAVIVLGDLLMALIFFGNAMACVAILAVAFWKKRRHAKAIIQTSAAGRG